MAKKKKTMKKAAGPRKAPKMDKAPSKKKPPAKQAPRAQPRPITRNPQPKATVPKPAPTKPSVAQPPPEKKGPVPITPEVRRLWIRMRQAWVVSYDAFNHSVAMLDKRQAEMMYDVVKRSLYRDNFAEVLRAHPELKELLRSDDDRMCMHDIYQRLAYRLDRYEPLPSDKRAYLGMKGGIGRNVPDLEV